MCAAGRGARSVVWLSDLLCAKAMPSGLILFDSTTSLDCNTAHSLRVLLEINALLTFNVLSIFLVLVGVLVVVVFVIVFVVFVFVFVAVFVVVVFVIVVLLFVAAAVVVIVFLLRRLLLLLFF